MKEGEGGALLHLLIRVKLETDNAVITLPPNPPCFPASTLQPRHFIIFFLKHFSSLPPSPTPSDIVIMQVLIAWRAKIPRPCLHVCTRYLISLSILPLSSANHGAALWSARPGLNRRGLGPPWRQILVPAPTGRPASLRYAAGRSPLPTDRKAPTGWLCQR